MMKLVGTVSPKLLGGKTDRLERQCHHKLTLNVSHLMPNLQVGINHFEFVVAKFCRGLLSLSSLSNA